MVNVVFGELVGITVLICMIPVRGRLFIVAHIQHFSCYLHLCLNVFILSEISHKKSNLALMQHSFCWWSPLWDLSVHNTI